MRDDARWGTISYDGGMQDWLIQKTPPYNLLYTYGNDNDNIFNTTFNWYFGTDSDNTPNSAISLLNITETSTMNSILSLLEPEILLI